MFDRFANTFYNWGQSGFITIMDNSVPRALEESLLSILSRNATMSMFRLKPRYTRTNLKHFKRSDPELIDLVWNI